MNFDELHKIVESIEWKPFNLDLNPKGEKQIKPFTKFVSKIPVEHVSKLQLDSPCYNAFIDAIGMFKMEDHSEGEYYSILFHELCHATGRRDRLNRVGVVGWPHVTYKQKAEEELIAEIGSLLLCKHFNIDCNYERKFSYIRNFKKEYFKKFGFLGLSKKSLEMCYNQALQARDYVINNLLEVNQ